MDSIAMIAARVWRRHVSENPKPTQTDRDDTARSEPWRRAPRTKAALANKMRAIQKVIEILERLNVAFSQPLPGKFVIEPLPRVTRGKAIVFWPARRRLRIGRCSTETNGIHAFQQALADQGHPILGYLSRAKPPKPPRVSKAERLRARQEANLAEMAQAHAERVAFFRKRSSDALVEQPPQKCSSG
jgi:hypothetical protein